MPDIDMLIELRQNVATKIDALESALAELRGLLSAQKAIVDSLSMDHRALNTSIQNTALSFGAIRERMESLQAILKDISDSKGEAIEKVLEHQREKLLDCRQLCTSQIESVSSKVTTLGATLENHVAALEKAANSSDTNLDKRISDIESKINNTLYGVLITVVLWLIKLLYPQLGGA